MHTQYASKFGKLSSGHRTGKGVFIPIPKQGNAKECSNYHTIALISHTNKVMLKILQAVLKWYVNRELPDIQAGFRKGRGTRDQVENICGSSKKQENSRKTSTSASLKERDGNWLQHSCLGNPMDRGAWWATVHGVTKSQT